MCAYNKGSGEEGETPADFKRRAYWLTKFKSEYVLVHYLDESDRNRVGENMEYDVACSTPSILSSCRADNLEEEKNEESQFLADMDIDSFLLPDHCKIEDHFSKVSLTPCSPTSFMENQRPLLMPNLE